MTDVTLDKGYTRDIIGVATAYKCLRNQLAYILATAEWETAHTMEPVKEAYWLDEAWRANNLSYYPWYGRGFVQLTWETNYVRAEDELKLGTQLTDDPDNALDPVIAARVLVRGSMEGWFTGKCIPDYCTLSKSDYVNARRVINGTDSASDIAALAMQFEALLLDEGYGCDDTDTDTDVPQKPDIVRPVVDIGTISTLLMQYAEVVNDLQERVAELEDWRSS